MKKAFRRPKLPQEYLDADSKLQRAVVRGLPKAELDALREARNKIAKAHNIDVQGE